MNFEGKVILVTGAASGIGNDTARLFAKLGGKVAIIDRNEKLLHDVAEQIKSDGSPQPFAIVADVTKDAKRIIDETIKHFGKLDVLVNNAGILRHDTIVDFNLEVFEQVMDVNLRSALILTNLAVPYLEKTKGNIVNVSSIGGIRAITERLSYSISKAALDKFTKCSSLDLAPKGIRVNSVNPAAVRTSIFKTIGQTQEEVEKRFATKGYPVGRVGEASDISNAIVFLAHDTASFITGIILPVDGGSTTAAKF